jgi:hypothetical protein
MLGRNGCTQPAAPQPSPQPDANIDYNSDDSIDPRFKEWDEAFVADVKTEAVEETTQWGE